MPDVGADSENESSTSEPVDYRNEDGWEDVEADRETSTVLCLFGDSTFPDVGELLRHCRESHDFDLQKIRATFGVPPVHTLKVDTC